MVIKENCLKSTEIWRCLWGVSFLSSSLIKATWKGDKKVVEINVWLQDTSGGKATATAQEKLLRQVLFPVYKVFGPLVILAICILFKMLRSL